MILVGTECVEGKDYLDSIKECYDQSVLFLFYSSSFIFIYLFIFFSLECVKGKDYMDAIKECYDQSDVAWCGTLRDQSLGFSILWGLWFNAMTSRKTYSIKYIYIQYIFFFIIQAL